MPVENKRDPAKIETATRIVDALSQKEKLTPKEQEAYEQALSYLQGHLEGSNPIPTKKPKQWENV